MVINNNLADVESLTYKYTGYLKITGWTAENVGVAEIDGQNHLTIGKGTFSYEGYVKQSIRFYDSALGVHFTEFSTNPYELSQETKDFYSNIPEGNSDAWGELIIRNINNFEIKGKNFDWYESEENDSFDKMEFWGTEDKTYNFVDKVGGIPSDELSAFIIHLGAEPSEIQQSGYTKLMCNRNLDSKVFPVLIHENDIGKKNTIGPLKDDKGNEIYINLMIV